MLVTKVFNIPTKLPKHRLPVNIVNHCNIYKEANVKHASLFAWITLDKYIDLTKVRFGKNGKPYLQGNAKYFSLSHTNKTIAVAISDKPIGIDIEYILQNDICDKLAFKLLKKDQLQQYLKSKHRALWFTKYWTQHEAYLKLSEDTFSFKNLKKPIRAKCKTKQIKHTNKILILSVVTK